MLKQELREKDHRTCGKVVRYRNEGEQEKVEVEWPKRHRGEPLLQVVDVGKVQVQPVRKKFSLLSLEKETKEEKETREIDDFLKEEDEKEARVIDDFLKEVTDSYDKADTNDDEVMSKDAFTNSPHGTSHKPPWHQLFTVRVCHQSGLKPSSNN